MTAPPEPDHAGSLRTLVATHGRAVDALLRHLEHDPATREELWSDVFTVAFRRLDQLVDRPEAQVRRWLLSTARHLTANSARRAITRRRAGERLTSDVTTHECSAEDRYLDSLPADDDRSRRIHAAWTSLRTDERRVLFLAANGLDGPAIAEQLCITHQAARSRLMRARQAFDHTYRACGAPHHD